MWTLYEHRVVPPNLLHSYIWFVRYVNYFESLVTFLMNHSSQHLHPAFVFTIAMAICPALGSAAELTVVLFIHLMVGGLKIHICRLKFIDCHQSDMLKREKKKKLETFHLFQLCHISCTNGISLIVVQLPWTGTNPLWDCPRISWSYFFQFYKWWNTKEVPEKPWNKSMTWQQSGSSRSHLQPLFLKIKTKTIDISWLKIQYRPWPWMIVNIDRMLRFLKYIWCFRVQFLMKSGCVCFFRLRLDTSRIDYIFPRSPEQRGCLCPWTPFSMEAARHLRIVEVNKEGLGHCHQHGVIIPDRAVNIIINRCARNKWGAWERVLRCDRLRMPYQL